jgi:hypothetical protein
MRMALKKRGRVIGLTLAIASVLVLTISLTPQAREAVVTAVRGFSAPTPAAGPAAVAANGVTVQLDRTDRTPGGTVVHVSVKDTAGALIRAIHVVGLSDRDYLSSGGGEKGWDLRIPPSTTTLTIDFLTVTEAGNAAVDVDIPPKGSLTINRALAIGRFPLSLTTGRWVDDANRHVFRIGFHSAPVAGRLLSSWNLEGVGSPVIEGPDMRTGDGWMEFAADAGHSAPPGHVTLSFSDPVIEVDGPWVLRLD